MQRNTALGVRDQFVGLSPSAKSLLQAPSEARLSAEDVDALLVRLSAEDVDALLARLPSTTLLSVADACVLEAYSTLNVGTMRDMWAGYDDNPDTFAKRVRSLVKFNLSSIPTGATVSSAKLRLYLIASWDFPNRYRTVKAYRPGAAWSEGTVNWSNAPSPKESYGSVSIKHGSYRWYELDVTDLIGAYLAGTYTDTGIMIRGPESSGSDSGYRSFSTREGPYPPELVIDYGAAAPTDTLTPSITESGLAK